MTFYLVPDSLWWAGTLHHDAALSITGTTATLIPKTDTPGSETRADTPGSGTRVVPGTVLPGLVDAHVHTALADAATIRAGGIATVWDLGAALPPITRLAAAAAAQADGDPALRNSPPLPRIRYAGPFLTAPGGYPSDRVWAPPGSWRELHSPADASEFVGEALAAGATLIKATLNAGGPLLPPATITAVADAAHAAGLPLIVHAEGPGTVATAVDCGADLLAHTPWTDELDPGLIRACAARTRWISTLDIHGWGEPTPGQAVALTNLRHFLDAGGQVRYGTDLGNGPLPAAVNPRELRALLAAGLTPDAVLTAMTDSAELPLTWLPTGLALDPATFPASLTTARVLTPAPVHPIDVSG